MEILCPNCQKKLTILEQHAGQTMKCPLCSNTFTAPALPQAPAAPPVFALAAESAPVPPAPPAPFSATPPAPPPPPPPAPKPAASLPPPRPLPPMDHTGRFSIWISPRFIQYVPAVALFLIFVLTFFSWIAYQPGGITIDSQSAWQVAIGRVSTDRDMEKLSIVQPRKASDDKSDVALPKPLLELHVEPGFDFMVFLYVLGVFFNLILAVAVLSVPTTEKLLPPQTRAYLYLRWPVLALVTLLVFGLFMLNHTVGFSMERRTVEEVDKIARKRDEALEKLAKGNDRVLTESELNTAKLETRIMRGQVLQSVVETYPYRLVYRLHLLAVLFALIMMLAELRQPRPSPRIDVLY